jgi:dihydrofolate reductase
VNPPRTASNHRPRHQGARLCSASAACSGDDVGARVCVTVDATLLRQVITLGLLDELDLHIAPVILGDGMRLLDHRLELDTLEGIELTPDRVTATDDVTHIRYRVRERRALVLDNRGRDEQTRDG